MNKETVMKEIQFTLAKIKDNCRKANRTNTKRILILQEDTKVAIGDSCLWFGKLKHVSSFFNGAAIHLNIGKSQDARLVKTLLANSPYVESITSLEWGEIDFKKYETIICVTYDEMSLLEFFHGQYGKSILDEELKLVVFSLSSVILDPEDNIRDVFPVHEYLLQYAHPQLAELYVTSGERAWADEWLREKGFKDGERLFIMLDSTTSRDKLLALPVYFELLSFALDQPGTRVLVFDETGMGKEAFYRQWLGSADMQKMIFTNRNTLRQAFSLIASRHTAFMFGPCTGLMHCASSIFNHYVNTGMPVDEVPVMVVYTGEYQGWGLNAYKWWGTAPLVHCLMVKDKNGNGELRSLADLPAREKELNNSLPCKEFTSEMLIDFCGEKLRFSAKQKRLSPV